MNYLERNQLVIVEIGDSLRLQRNALIGKGTISRFTSVGHYRSALLGEDVYVGLKESPHKQDDFLQYCVARDLALIRLVEQRLPHLLPEFPVFYGVLEDVTGKSIGTLMEDFSQGGKYKVEEVTRSWCIPVLDKEVPKELEGIAEREIDNHDLATMCFLINRQRKIGDFDEMYHGTANEIIERYPTDDLLDELRKYTLRIDYPL